MNFKDLDCIFALATSSQRSALHIHRLTGTNLFSYFQNAFYTKKNNSPFRLFQTQVEKRYPLTRYLVICDQDQHVIDDVIVTAYFAPWSYTGEEVLEISCHGNPLIDIQLQKFFRNLGLRDALPGEFTQRAYLNHKMDLTQAEGIAELIHAQTFGGLDLARSAIQNGHLSHLTEKLLNELIDVMSYFEAHIDFSSDEVGEYDSLSALPKIHEIHKQLCDLLSSYQNGVKLKEGLKITICGKPNAGKSSLYNALLRHDKAIVTEIPGTTRDVLEDRLMIDSRDFILLDTAGLRHTDDLVERIGVSRSLENAKNTDIILYVVDASDSDLKRDSDDLIFEKRDFSHRDFLSAAMEEFQNFELEIGKREEQSRILVFHKLDKISTERQQYLLNQYQEFNGTVVLTSKYDLRELEQCLVKLYDKVTGHGKHQDSPILISARQKDKIEISIEFMEEVEALIHQKEFPEKIASLLVSIQKTLGELIGEVSLDSIYEKIFSTFCIGK